MSLRSFLNGSPSSLKLYSSTRFKLSTNWWYFSHPPHYHNNPLPTSVWQQPTNILITIFTRYDDLTWTYTVPRRNAFGFIIRCVRAVQTLQVNSKRSDLRGNSKSNWTCNTPHSQFIQWYTPINLTRYEKRWSDITRYNLRDHCQSWQQYNITNMITPSEFPLIVADSYWLVGFSTVTQGLFFWSLSVTAPTRVPIHITVTYKLVTTRYVTRGPCKTVATYNYQRNEICKKMAHRLIATGRRRHICIIILQWGSSSHLTPYTSLLRSSFPKLS